MEREKPTFDILGRKHPLVRPPFRKFKQECLVVSPKNLTFVT